MLALSRSILRICPNFSCSSQLRELPTGPLSNHFVRCGPYFRKDDGKWVPRFRCRSCLRKFSSSVWTRCYRQKKRSKNRAVLKLLASHGTERRTARILGLNRKTVSRKALFWAEVGRLERLSYLQKKSMPVGQIPFIQFDEMETFERSKALPLSIPLVVEAKTRRILSFRVAKMPASGRLAELSRQKYGPRKDEREQAAREVLREIRGSLSPEAHLTSDQNPKYPGWIRRELTSDEARPLFVKHLRVKGRQPREQGFGELKKGGFDPIFSLNHTAAMKRANVARLIRKTWTTTKRPNRLLAHLELYAYFHNTVLIRRSKT